MSNAAMPPSCRFTSGPRSPSSAVKAPTCSIGRGDAISISAAASRSRCSVTPPHLVAVLEAQAEGLHCSNLYGIEPQQRLAERLVAHSFADTAFFCNSGAEALECAIKMARRFHT